MTKTLNQKEITIQKLEKEVSTLRKKMFLYETLQAEKEIEKGQIKGPFKRGKEIINHIKS
ncbi:MAG: hypothetical protein KJ967_03140 [Elusimicrobia bacterium]|nr:hypothetical protein [Elusimicrobiota bacterium]